MTVSNGENEDDAIERGCGKPPRVAVTTLDDLFSAQFFVMTNCACSSCTPDHPDGSRDA